MICGRCGKTVYERVVDGWHEFYGCDCPPRSYAVDPIDKRKVLRREPSGAPPREGT